MTDRILRNQSWTRPVCVLIVFTLLTAVFFASILPGLSHALIGPPEDNLQDFWNSWYAAAGADYRHFFETDLVRYPAGAPLAYHSFAYPQVFLLVALTKLFGTAHGTLILLQNLTLLASFPLAGLGAFYLVRHFTREDASALAGGFVFAFNPAHVAQVLHHAHVSQIEFIPFFALAWILTIERKSARWLAVSIALYALCALSCWYYAFYMGYFIIFHAIYLRLRDDELPKGWRLAAPILCVAGTALLLSPLLVPMFAQGHVRGLYYPGSNIFVADLVGFVTFPPQHLLAAITETITARFSGNAWEAVVYLGLANLALIVWLALRRTPEKDRIRTYALSGMIGFAVLALGDTLHVLGHDYTFMHLPNIILSKLPFVSNARTPARIVVLVYLFLAIGVGHALAQISRKGRTPRSLFVLSAALILILLDYYPARLKITAADCPAALSAIARDPDRNFGVLNLPLTYVEGNLSMFYQTCHGRPVAHAILSRITRPSLVDRLIPRPGDQQRQQLEAAHVKYIVIDERIPWQNSLGRKSDYYERYRPRARGKELTILQVY